MSKKRKYALIFGILGVAVVSIVIMLNVIFAHNYNGYDGQWEMKELYLYDENTEQYVEIPWKETRHVLNKDTEKYDVIQGKRYTFNIDEQGNFIHTGAFGKQEKGKLKKQMGKVYYTGKDKFVGAFRWDFEKSGDRLVVYEGDDPDSATDAGSSSVADNVIVLDTDIGSKRKEVYVRK